MSTARLACAVILGVLLGTIPWWRYAAPGGGPERHADHAARYGGQLAMAGDHHVELVRDGEWVAVHVSDARRRPVRPVAASVVVDGGRKVPLRWKGRRFVGAYPTGGREIETIVMLGDRQRLSVTFDVAAASPARAPRQP